MATVTTSTVIQYNLALSADEASAVLALVGACASVEDSITGAVYDALKDAGVPDTHVAGNRTGGWLGTIYVTKRDE